MPGKSREERGLEGNGMETSEVSGTLESEGQRLLRELSQKKNTSSVVC